MLNIYAICLQTYALDIMIWCCTYTAHKILLSKTKTKRERVLNLFYKNCERVMEKKHI